MSDKKRDKKKHAEKAAKEGKKAAKKKAEKKAAKATKKLLKELTCTGCKKHCPLSDPKCKKGRAQAEAALADLLGRSA